MLMMLAVGLPGRTWESELTRFAADADDARGSFAKSVQ